MVAEEDARLFHRKLVKGSVSVRSTSRSDVRGCITYKEGEDYAVNYQQGTLRRLKRSRIPDYTTNSLYGKTDFNHVNFPGFTNNRHFVYVDYEWTDPIKWPVQKNQARLLPRTQDRLKRGEPLKICAFGDSITNGGEATAPELVYWNRWAASLRSRYPKAAITAVNSATGGDTTAQGLQRLEQKVLREQPDLVLVAFGMNDQNVGSIPLDRFRENLRQLVDRIRANGPAEIILLSSCLPNPNWHFTSGKMPEYGRVTAEVAKEKKCAFADVLTNWQAVVERKKPEDHLANNVNHPNDYGHWIYAQVLEKLGL